MVVGFSTLGFDASDRPGDAYGAVAAEEVSALPDERGASILILQMNTDWVVCFAGILIAQELFQSLNMMSSLP
jgi:hypothetical protein